MLQSPELLLWDPRNKRLIRHMSGWFSNSVQSVAMEMSDFGKNFHPVSVVGSLLKTEGLLCSEHQAPCPEGQNVLRQSW